jgi:4-amino-4-deoxy-L-arabinose transferase-like glycosyltransferase
MRFRHEIILAAATLGIGGLLWGSHQVVAADHATYITSGINLFAGKGFTSPGGWPETWFPPVYPLLIGVLNILTGDGMLAAKLVSLAASVVWVLAFYRVGRSIGGETVGLVAAVILLVQPDRALFSVLSMSQAVFSALLWSAVALYIADPGDARPTTAPLTGVLLGLAALTRPEGLLAAGVIVMDRAVRLWPTSPRRAVTRAGILAAAFAIVLLPYIVYLYRTTGKLTMTGKTEINLAVGRSLSSGEPLYRIDPSTLDLVMNRGQGGARDLVRYARNLREEVRLIAGQLDHVWLFWASLDFHGTESP